MPYQDLYDRIGDPDFADVPTERLLSKKYAAELRERISQRAAASVSPDLGDDTTYLCAVDAGGNGCSFINSLYMGFGSGVVADETGVCLQNRGHSFQLDPDHPNASNRASVRCTLSSPASLPKTVPCGRPLGVMGGPMQPQGHAQLLANLIDYGMNPQEAVDHARHFHNDDVLLLEGRVPASEAEELRRRGHQVEVEQDYVIPAGGAQLIRVLKNGVRACGSDPRKDGCALAQ